MQLNSIVLRFIARSSDALVAFVTMLDSKLDDFLIRFDNDITRLKQDAEEILVDTRLRIEQIEQDTEVEIEALRFKAAGKVQAVKAKATAKVERIKYKVSEVSRAADIIKDLKNSPPKGK